MDAYTDSMMRLSEARLNDLRGDARRERVARVARTERASRRALASRRRQLHPVGIVVAVTELPPASAERETVLRRTA